MKRAFAFPDRDDPNRELVVAETNELDRVELRVGGLAVTLEASEWLAFAKLVNSTLSQYGEHPLLVDLGRTCKECQGTAVMAVVHDEGEPTVDEPCVKCDGRGFLPGSPERDI